MPFQNGRIPEERNINQFIPSQVGVRSGQDKGATFSGSGHHGQPVDLGSLFHQADQCSHSGADTEKTNRAADVTVLPSDALSNGIKEQTAYSPTDKSSGKPLANSFQGACYHTKTDSGTGTHQAPAHGASQQL